MAKVDYCMLESLASDLARWANITLVGMAGKLLTGPLVSLALGNSQPIVLLNPLRRS